MYTISPNRVGFSQIKITSPAFFPCIKHYASLMLNCSHNRRLISEI